MRNKRLLTYLQTESSGWTFKCIIWQVALLVLALSFWSFGLASTAENNNNNNVCR